MFIGGFETDERVLVVAEIGNNHDHFRNSAIVALARGDAGWSVDWILTPETVTE